MEASPGTNQPTLVFAGSLAQRAGKGGSTWARLQWVLGFMRLGWKVVYVDRLDPDVCVDGNGRACRPEDSVNVTYFLRVMERFGVRAFAVLSDEGEIIVGPSRKKLLEAVAQSTLLLNVMGFIRDQDVLGLAGRRVFLDIDPGFGQLWRAQGLADVLSDHDAYVTIGENIGGDGCSIPTCGLRWVTTPQPVVLSEWPVQSGPGERYTSVASWRGAYGPMEHNGKRYGLRVHEFRRFVGLPLLSGRQFELALDIHPTETDDIALLRRNRWRLTCPRTVAGDPCAYRTYVQQSRAEFMVAKSAYVESRSGWFSDRSMCYLASGRPAIVQDTGFSHRYPTGVGLLAFSTPDEALAAVEDVEASYERHAVAARSVAERYFSSDRVIGRLLDELDVQ